MNSLKLTAVNSIFQKLIPLVAMTLLSWSYASLAHAELYEVDSKQSTVEWVGKKVTGKHNGSISIKKGSVNIDDGKVTGGEFEIDMTSIKVLDIKDPKENAKLTKHLKSDDFFSVEKHPTAKFVITKVEEKGPEKAEITGNLIIKGITHAVTIPAKVSDFKDGYDANGTVKLDRTKWDVRYGSGKFFKGLGDRLIYDDFDLKFYLSAKPAAATAAGKTTQ